MARRILKEFVIDRIAAVDRPCQEHATVTIMKRAPEEEGDDYSALHQMTMLKASVLQVQLEKLGWTDEARKAAALARKHLSFSNQHSAMADRNNKLAWKKIGAERSAHFSASDAHDTASESHMETALGASTHAENSSKNAHSLEEKLRSPEMVKSEATIAKLKADGLLAAVEKAWSDNARAAFGRGQET